MFVLFKKSLYFFYINLELIVYLFFLTTKHFACHILKTSLVFYKKSDQLWLFQNFYRILEKLQLVLTYFRNLRLIFMTFNSFFCRRNKGFNYFSVWTVNLFRFCCFFFN